MRQLFCLFVCLICGFGFVACEQSVVSEAKVVSESSTSVSSPIPKVIQEQEPEEPKANGIFDLANKILDKVDDKSGDAQKAKEWMNDKLGGQSGGDSFIPDDAAKWAADAFEKLKAKGLTDAVSPGQWLQEDIRNMNALKYKIVKVKLDDTEVIEDELNKLGKLRWDCFHVTEKNGEMILFFKKERRSVLKNIPVRDMMKLVPLMGNGE